MKATDKKGNTSLNYAVYFEGTESTERLLLGLLKENDKDTLTKMLKEKDNEGKTALHWAAIGKNPGVISYLLNFLDEYPDFSDTDISNLVLAKDGNGKNSLHYTVNCGGKEPTEELLLFLKKKKKKGISIYEDTLTKLLKDEDDFFKRTALHWVSVNNDEESTETLGCLLDYFESNLKDSEINDLILAPDINKSNALHCTSYDHTDIDFIEKTKKLLEFSLKKDNEILIGLIKAKDENKRTALHLAAVNKRNKILKYHFSFLLDNSDLLNSIHENIIEKLLTDEASGENTLYAARKNIYLDNPLSQQTIKLIKSIGYMIKLIKSNDNEFKVMLDYFSGKNEKQEKSWETVLLFIRGGADINYLSNTNYILLKEYIEKISSNEEKEEALQLIRNFSFDFPERTLEDLAGEAKEYGLTEEDEQYLENLKTKEKNLELSSKELENLQIKILSYRLKQAGPSRI